MRKGFSLVEILVALALFGLLSGFALHALLGSFRIHQSSRLEGTAALVAKAYLERALAEARYEPSTGLLTLPALQAEGFAARLEAGGRSSTQETPSLSPCQAGQTGFTCSATCNGGGCRLILVRLTLSDRGRSFTFQREFQP